MQLKEVKTVNFPRYRYMTIKIQKREPMTSTDWIGENNTYLLDAKSK